MATAYSDSPGRAFSFIRPTLRAVSRVLTAVSNSWRTPAASSSVSAERSIAWNFSQPSKVPRSSSLMYSRVGNPSFAALSAIRPPRHFGKRETEQESLEELFREILDRISVSCGRQIGCHRLTAVSAHQGNRLFL